MLLMWTFFLTQQCVNVLVTGYLLDDFVDLKNPLHLDPAPDTLKYVFAIARAGTRTPKFDVYPNHPGNKDFKAYWGAEKGELTEYGKQLMTALGTSLSYRYKNFTSSLTKPRILTTADEETRTVISAQLVAEKLFGNTDIDSTDKENMDKYRLFAKSNPLQCKKFEEDRNKTMDYLKQEDTFKPAQVLQKATGVTHPLSHLDILEILDTLDMQKANYKEMSEELVGFHKFNMAVYDLSDFVVGRFEPFYDKFTAGPLFHQLFKEFYDCGSDCKGFHLHMTHSLILESAMIALLISSYRPYLGTTLIVELHEGNLVTVLLYQPLSWNKPGLTEATEGSGVGKALKILCGNSSIANKQDRFYCNQGNFRKSIPDCSQRKWDRKCKRDNPNN